MNILETAAAQYRQGRELARQGRSDWIRGTLQMAAALWSARQQFPDNQTLSHWLVDNEIIDLNDHDRAALIKMGEHIEEASKILPETTSYSYQLIWNEIRDRLANVSKTASINSLSPNGSYEAENGEIAESNGEIQINSGSRRASERNTPERNLSERNPLSRRERGAEAWSMYRSSVGRTALSKAMARRHSDDLWQLILTSMDHGFLTPNQVSPSGQVFSARMLFPSAPVHGSFAAYDLSTTKGRTFIKDVIMPVAIACKEAILAEPHRVEEICDSHRRTQSLAVVEQRQQQEVARVLSAAPGQQEIIFYGERFWPARHDEYDYDQVRAAVWYFRNISDGLGVSRSSPRSVAISIRHTIKFLMEYATHRAPDQRKMKTIFSIIKNITLAWDRNPDGECKFPGFPIGGIEGRWD